MKKSVRLCLIFMAAACLIVCFVLGITVSQSISHADEDITVTVNPEDATLVYGEQAYLHAEGTTPSSEPITYTWFEEGSDTVVYTGSTLILNQISQSGKYFCRLTAEIGGVDKTVDTSLATISITPRPIKISVSSPSTEYGEPLQTVNYQLYEGTFAYTDTINDLHVTINKAVGSDAGRYPLTGTYNNGNYAVTFLPANYTITPKYLEARLIGAENLTYTGRTPNITAELIGAPEGETINLVVAFNKAVKNAGDYVAYIRTDNKNYAINGEEVDFCIKKAPLIISIDETILKVGDEMKPNYSYRGLVNNETESVLTTLPQVSLTTSNAGLFTTTPFGAESSNYDISYEEGEIQINVAEVVGENAIAQGSFAYNGNATITSEQGLQWNINKLTVYTVTMEGTTSDGEYTVTINDAPKFPRIFMRAAVMDEEGVRHGTIYYGYEEEKLVYTADVPGTFVLYYDLTVPAIIIIGLLLMLFIIACVKGRDRRRYKKLRNRHFIAEQYASRCRVRDEE